MKAISTSGSAFFVTRIVTGVVLCSAGVLLALAGLTKSVTGMVRHTDDAGNSPQTIAVTSTVTAVELFPTSVNFGEQKAGRVNQRHSITLTNTGSTLLSIRGIGIVGNNLSDFIATTTCDSSVPPASTCTIDVRFAPTATGYRTASLRVRHDGGGEQPITLTGIGTP